ncbi:porin family protein [Marinobacter bohaiensis]|uniref:hypothetical protein n=1 Tax=Marinobacter bohaiensis TaxID=2201898 RepID=UPI0013A6BAD7|nr:hypothetical protein [Marinobacter bohaiensis]
MARYSESGMIRGLFTVTTLALYGVCTMAYAEPARITVGADSRLSDNVERSESNEQTDLENRVTLGIRHRSDPGRCNSDLAADLAYGVYLDDTYDPETYANIDWLGSCQLMERLFWDASNETRDVIQDDQASNTPDNRTRRNIFRTGPRYVWAVTTVDTLSFSVEYENIDYKEPEERDSDGYITTAFWRHLFSQTLAGGLNLSADRTEYDNGEDVDRYTATLFFSKEFAATTISGSFGGTRLEREFGPQESEFDGWVGDLRMERQINASSSVYIAASREITDEASEFDFEFNDVTYTIEDTNALEVTDVRAGYNRENSDGSSFELTGVANRSDNLDTDSREGRVALVVDYRRPVTGQIDFTAGADAALLSYKDDDTEDHIFGIDLGLSTRLLSDLDLSGKIGHNRRTSDVSSREYTENWVSVSVEYQFR